MYPFFTCKVNFFQSQANFCLVLYNTLSKACSFCPGTDSINVIELGLTHQKQILEQI